MSIRLRRWQRPGGGSERPGERALGLALGRVSVGLRELACDLAVNASSSFAREARLMTQWWVGPFRREKLRQVVEAEGRRVIDAQRQRRFALAWQARGCADAACEGSLVCVGVDGVMTRQITDEEKVKRRRKTAGKRGARARAGRKLKPLAPRKKGADGPWKEVKPVGAYDKDHAHRPWRSTVEDHRMAAVLLRIN